MDGTKRYQGILDWEFPKDPERANLLRKVWKPTPWIIDTKWPEPNSIEWFDLFEWLEENIGPESSPIHNREGVWHRGSATVHGHTDVGFATEEMMNRFIEHWPDYVWTDPDET